MKPYERIRAALDGMGAKLKRGKKHLVYELPNGKTFVMSNSPSDTRRGEMNALADLRAVAGVDVREERRKAPAEVRAERRRRPGRAGEPRVAATTAMAAAFVSAGFVEQLQARIAELESDRDRLEIACDQRDVLIGELRARLAALRSLWVVRFWMWLQRRVG